MVRIAKSFNEEMDEYLDRLYGKRERYIDTVKRRPKLLKRSEARVPAEVSEEEVFVEYDDAAPRGFLSWLRGLFSSSPDASELDDLSDDEVKVLEDVEDEVAEIDEEIEELEDLRESLWSRFLKRLHRARARSVAVDEEVALDEGPVLDDEVRQVLKRLHVWLEKLPPSTMGAFKRSPDFEAYKAVLEKYGLVKKKDDA